ncbi:hypothetical protein A2955_04515 [Candidatus Woesebacteria bacterium RIFCSPLOWO2_01_FULL_37_19]|uniref:Methyltransferase domain-containing protein n=1 Tax=Candidatus Woesebacteria bacterium RIFCSPLOWO2_01_FULL_37_19 TaxID=1802514 RepID=A0A1F8B733_9BACT|nr:MAG: hypothetical protein A2955_04515 [Candidatus Woesebacteria bacterium RIFCSPLOWO2_01_FULL_37_19]
MQTYQEDIFKGTAWYYARYRPKYPQELFKYLVIRFNLGSNGILLDLGCGTGELTIPLARYFEDVIAFDPNEEMLNEAKRKAKRLS